MMYAASESNPGMRFFEYPLQAIEEQLDEMNEQNECCFIGLDSFGNPLPKVQ
jgi:hypothetical protein